MKQLHVSDPSTLAKKHQGETNDRLDAIIRQQQETNRLLALIAERLAASGGQ
jgi:hypothetical protein